MDAIEAINRIRENHCHNDSNRAIKCPMQANDSCVNACRDACMYGADCCEYLVAIEALGKQIPKKPTVPNEVEASTFVECPSCRGTLIRFNDQKYCRYCGRALDWDGLE